MSRLEDNTRRSAAVVLAVLVALPVGAGRAKGQADVVSVNGVSLACEVEGGGAPLVQRVDG